MYVLPWNYCKDKCALTASIIKLCDKSEMAVYFGINFCIVGQKVFPHRKLLNMFCLQCSYNLRRKPVAS